jgi:hypothetical protein
MDNIAHALSGLAAQAGAVGDSGTYFCRNDSGYTAYFFWNASSIDPDQTFGATNDFEECNVTMPRCSGVTGNEPSPGDLMSAGGTYWAILSVKKLGLPMNPAAYQLRIRREPEANRVP